ncbi:MAG: AmmeMemoRadiSam system protein A [Planctomycetota bacterium]|jgi:AmmeMemoRadiSam system protein A
MSELSAEARKALIAVARRAVEAAVRGEPEPDFPPEATEGPVGGELAEPRGCFVTLKTRGRLRGCLGHFEADAPARERVREMARASTLDDPRFGGDRIRPDELGEVDIEISVLYPREKVDDPLSIELGRDGIYVRRGARSGCFLPQVATETGWTKEQFLSNCCLHKAGLEADAWRETSTEVLRFRAEVFGEED